MSPKNEFGFIHRYRIFKAIRKRTTIRISCICQQIKYGLKPPKYTAGENGYD